MISFLEKILQSFAKRVAEKTETNLDDMVLDIFFSSMHTAIYLLAFYIAWQFVEAPESLNT